jgi:hypothetical protein
MLLLLPLSFALASPLFDKPNGLGVGSLVALPFVLAGTDLFRDRNMSFVSIKCIILCLNLANQVYIPGHHYMLDTKNHGLSSDFHLRVGI